MYVMDMCYVLLFVLGSQRGGGPHRRCQATPSTKSRPSCFKAPVKGDDDE